MQQQVAEEGNDRKVTKTVSFSCDGDGSASFDREKGEAQDMSENGSVEAEECRDDQKFSEILVSRSAGSEPLCEMPNEWTPVLRATVIDSGAAETVIPWKFPNHKTVESVQSKRGVFHTRADCRPERTKERRR